MPYVQRESDGLIVGKFELPQIGYAEEYLADNDPELVNPVLTEAAIRERIAAIEREDLMNRRAREAFILQAESIAFSQYGLTPEQLYAVNPGYKGAVDVDNEIKALREQL